MSERFATQFGEWTAGRGVNAAHVNTVLGVKGGPVERAWTTALATPTAGHVPFVAVIQPGIAVQPFTLIVNTVTIESEEHRRLTWGACQAGVASGVADALDDGTIASTLAAHLVLIAAVWVSPAANDADAVFRNHREATSQALHNGARMLPQVSDVLSARANPWNPDYLPRS
jgi:5,6,7,8-tetrahydromethanopterin hydro-lyase